MEVVERLALEVARGETLLACEHRHRYEFAARLCEGRRVLDLCCGSGYGAEILARHAREVVGVDNDAATIDAARLTFAGTANISFELADALSCLRRDLADEFDLLVCFEGLEHLHDLERALALLRDHAARGLALIVSVPNSKLFSEQNPFHVTDFGYDEALRAFGSFPGVVMLPQFLAEGSVICPQEAEGIEVELVREDRDEPAYANHFIFCVALDPTEVSRAHHGKLQLEAAPAYNRFAEGIKHANAALARENARLARERLGRSGSGAASGIVAVPRERAALDAEREAWRERARLAEARVTELEEALTRARAASVRPPSADFRTSPIAPAAADGRLRQPLPGEDPNSWEQRHRRAAQHLVPWLEQTFPLEGKTVLEYGCGNGAVTCAVAARAARVIGLDIDQPWLEQARGQLRERGLDNAELELHPAESILDAARRYEGQVDMLLLYAVLEHLTIAERLRLLRLATELVAPGGVIAVCEAPNRLIYFDHHTAQMPFFHLLPDELALACYQRSRRPDFRAAIDAAVAEGDGAGLEAIARWGRGVSFHEFEVAFGRLEQHVIACNYDPLLLAERPVHPDEAILARYLERWRPELPPVFSRYWLDLILVPEPITRRQPWIRPWPLSTSEATRASYTERETVRLPDQDALLWVSLPHPTKRLLVGALGAPGELVVRARPEQAIAPLSVACVDPPGAEPGGARYATFMFSEPAHRVALSAADGCEIAFVGYEE